jgi:hypothetical protein
MLDIPLWVISGMALLLTPLSAFASMQEHWLSSTRLQRSMSLSLPHLNFYPHLQGFLNDNSSGSSQKTEINFLTLFPWSHEC